MSTTLPRHLYGTTATSWRVAPGNSLVAVAACPPRHSTGHERDRWRYALLAAGVFLGVCAVGPAAGFVGRTFGVVVMLAAFAAVGAVLVAVDRPVLAVAAVLLCPAVGLRSAGPGGLQVVQILALLAVLVVVNARLAVHSPRIPTGAPLVWANVLVVAALLSTVAAERVEQGLRTDLNLLLGVGVAWCVVAVTRTTSDLRRLLRAATIGSVLVTVPALLRVNEMRGSYGGAIVEGRLMGVFTQPNELGSFAVVSFFTATAFFLASRRLGDRVIASAAAAAGLGCSVFSLSRGSWFGMTTGLVVLIVLFPPAWRYVVGAFTTVCGLVAVLVLIDPFPAQTGVLVDRVSTLTGGTRNPDDRRDLVWEEAWHQLIDSPLVGQGPGAFQLEPVGTNSPIAQYYRLHAHNVLLHVGAETGLFGVVALVGLTLSVAFLAWSAARALRRAGHRRHTAALACLTAVCASYVGHGLVDVVFQNPQLMVVMWVSVGFVVAAARTSPVVPRPRRPGPVHVDRSPRPATRRETA